MYNYISGNVLLIERRPNTPAITVTVCCNGLGIPVKLYKLAEHVRSGEHVQFYIISAYSDQVGYTFYGFYDTLTWGLASRLCNVVNGVGVSGVAALIHNVPFAVLRATAKGLGGPKFGIKGIGPTKENELRRALQQVFAKLKTDDTLGDNLEVAVVGAKSVLEDILGADIDDNLLGQLAIKLPAETVSASTLVQEYIRYVRETK